MKRLLLAILFLLLSLPAHAVDIIVGAGQSNISNWESTTYCSTGSASDGANRWTGSAWAAPTSAAECNFLNPIVAQQGATYYVNTAVGGSCLWANAERCGNVGNAWLTSLGARGPLYTAMQNTITATGGTVKTIIWHQGENEGCYQIDEETYYDGLIALFGYFKADYPSAKIAVVLLGRNGCAPSTCGGDDATWTGIRNAQYSAVAATEGAYISGVTADLGMHATELLHYTAAGYQADGSRNAQSWLWQNGYASYGRGPYLSYISRVDSTHIDVHIIHRGGTDYTPTSSITGFTVLNDGTPVTVSSAAQQTTDTIRLTTSSTTWGTTITVRYQYGLNPTITGAVKDNSAATLPLESGSITSETAPATTSHFGGSGVGINR